METISLARDSTFFEVRKEERERWRERERFDGNLVKIAWNAKASPN
jgi:hypothetical protein